MNYHSPMQWSRSVAKALVAGVFPNLGAVGAASSLSRVIGALLMFVLIGAVLSVVVSAILWATSAFGGNYALTHKARTGVLVSLGVAALAGAGVGWINFLIRLGHTL